MWSWVSLLVLILQAAVAFSVDCVWDKDKDFPQYQPLIFASNDNFVLPVMEGGKRIVRVAAGDTVTLACPGSHLVFIGRKEAEGVCVSSGKLEITGSGGMSGKQWDMVSLGCKDEVKASLLKKNEKCGSNDIGELYVIGYQLIRSRVEKEIVKVCFDHQNETPLYTRNVIHGASINAPDRERKRRRQSWKYFIPSSSFSVSMDKVYKKVSQIKCMEKILGDKKLAEEIIINDGHSEFYFARGHLSPDADFVIMPNKQATYHYINAVPQWQVFNNGNWKKVEDLIRSLAAKKKMDLVVYTGGWEVRHDISSKSVEVFLGLEEGKKVVPAPQVIWKVVHDQSTNSAAAVVGVNNPYLQFAPAPICQSQQCSFLNGLGNNADNLKSGYIYCCEVDELRKAIPHVPALGRVSLLN